MKKGGQYRITTVSKSGRTLCRCRKALLPAMGDALEAFQSGARTVRLDGPEGFVDFTLLSRALRGRPLSVPCYGGADLEIGGCYWNRVEEDHVPAVVNQATGMLRFYHSPEECMVAVARLIFLPADDTMWEQITG